MTCGWAASRLLVHPAYERARRAWNGVPLCGAPASHAGNAIDGIRYLCPRHAAAWRRLYGPVLALR